MLQRSDSLTIAAFFTNLIRLLGVPESDDFLSFEAGHVITNELGLMEHSLQFLRGPYSLGLGPPKPFTHNST